MGPQNSTPSNKHSMPACPPVSLIASTWCKHSCAHACVRACVRAFVHSCIHAFVHSCIRAFVLTRCAHESELTFACRCTRSGFLYRSANRLHFWWREEQD